MSAATVGGAGLKDTRRTTARHPDCGSLCCPAQVPVRPSLKMEFQIVSLIQARVENNIFQSFSVCLFIGLQTHGGTAD